MKWIPVKVLPNEGQKVFYHYVGGTFAGMYYGLSDNEDLRGLPCFGGDSGFLCGDVTHWMPREDGDLLPEKPHG